MARLRSPAGTRAKNPQVSSSIMMLMRLTVLVSAALPFMKGSAGANIVNISSAAAHLGGSAYGNSKLAVAGLTITFVRELGPVGIRANAISPGLILTDTIRAELPEATKAHVKRMQLIDAEGAEQDIVEAMLYLTSPAARFVTGEVLRVTGGMAAGI
jgi:3-oxoacyl-[acyl-carrier protein] reductase